MTITYQTDFNMWLEETAQLLLENRWQEIDKEHLEKLKDKPERQLRTIKNILAIV